MKFLTILLINLSVLAGGLFDGNTFSNGGDALQYLSNKIRANHSSSGANVDLSALANMTTEQWEKRSMFAINSDAFREIDLRGFTIEDYQVFSIELESANISEDRKEEMNLIINEQIETMERRVDLGLYHQPMLKRESCLQSCYHSTRVGDLACFRAEIAKREKCVDMSLINPMKAVCYYEANEEFDTCDEASSWEFQKCQASCYR